MVEGDMIQRNTRPQTTDTTAHHVRQVPVLCAKCKEPGEVIPLPGLGVEALNQDTLPPPRCLHHLAHFHLPTPHQWGVTHPPPQSRRSPIVRSKTSDLPSILVADTPQWKIRFKKVPDLHKRFLMEVCSLIVNTAELAQFAKGCEISDYTVSRAAMDNLGNDGECMEQALCRWWMSSNTYPCHKAYKVKLEFDQLDCPGLFGTLLDRYPELDPRGDEAGAAAKPLPGPSMEPSYDGDNGEKLDMDSHLWREECFHEVEEKLDRGITTLIMNLATLVDLADSMHLPRRIATLLVTT